MSITEDDTLSTADNNTDNYLIPTTSDKQRIIYIDNDATIEGILSSSSPIEALGPSMHISEGVLMLTVRPMI